MSKSPVASGIALSTGRIPLTDASSSVSAPSRSDPKARVVGEVARSRRLGPRAVDTYGDDVDRRAWTGGHRQRRGGRRPRESAETQPGSSRLASAGVGDWRGASCEREPYARRTGHASECVARRLDLDDRRTGLERASAQLGPGQVHQHAALPTGRLFGPTEVLDHASPCRVVVMRAVDAHAVHAVLEQVLDQAVIVGGFAGHRDHDRHAAIRRSPSRASVCALQQSPPGFEIDGSLAATRAGANRVRAPGGAPQARRQPQTGRAILRARGTRGPPSPAASAATGGRGCVARRSAAGSPRSRAESGGPARARQATLVASRPDLCGAEGLRRSAVRIQNPTRDRRWFAGRDRSSWSSLSITAVKNVRDSCS